MRTTALVTGSASPLELRVRLVLMAYAAGDAFGVGYEFLDEAVEVNLETLAARPGDGEWPWGGVSDDTLLTLLTIAATRSGDPEASANEFVQQLRGALPGLRGLGPTTRSALGLPVEPKDVPLIGTTNGAMMRTALLGLGYTQQQRRDRRAMVAALARATHTDSAAVASALLCSALFSRALETEAITLTDALWEEAAELPQLPDDILELLKDEEWAPPSGGISLNPVVTLGAVVWVVENSRTVSDAYRLACELGGDTDTVAALAGSLLIARSDTPEELLALPWIDDVNWAEIPELTDAAGTLTTLREVA